MSLSLYLSISLSLYIYIYIHTYGIHPGSHSASHFRLSGPGPWKVLEQRAQIRPPGSLSSGVVPPSDLIMMILLLIIMTIIIQILTITVKAGRVGSLPPGDPT